MQVNVIGYQLKQLFEKATKVLVVLGDGADIESSCLAVSLVELAESYNKKALLVTNNLLPEVAKPLVKPNQLKTQVEPKSLVLSFDWSKSQLDKISYKLEGDRFNLFIASRGKRLTPEEITYSYKGSDFDLIFSVGIKSLEELKRFGLEEETLSSVPSVNYDKNPLNSNFGKLNIINPGIDSLAALAVKSFEEAKINLPTKAAEILLFGIRSATNNFANIADPSTFEAAAYCKKAMIPGLTQAEKQSQDRQNKEEEESQAPESWLSPKVFRSNKFS